MSEVKNIKWPDDIIFEYKKSIWQDWKYYLRYERNRNKNIACERINKGYHDYQPVIQIISSCDWEYRCYNCNKSKKVLNTSGKIAKNRHDNHNTREYKYESYTGHRCHGDRDWVGTPCYGTMNLVTNAWYCFDCEVVFRDYVEYKCADCGMTDFTSFDNYDQWSYEEWLKKWIFEKVTGDDKHE